MKHLIMIFCTKQSQELVEFDKYGGGEEMG